MTLVVLSLAIRVSGAAPARLVTMTR